MRKILSILWALMIAMSGLAFVIPGDGGDNAGSVAQNSVLADPHIFEIDFWDAGNPAPPLGGGPSLLNSKVDVDNVYTFYIEANYTMGVVDGWSLTEIELSAWYDGGIVGAGSSPGDPSWTAEDYRTRQFNIIYNASTLTAMMNYPVGVPNEFEIDSWWEDPNTYGPSNNYHRLYINVSFGDQTYSADGDGIWDWPTGGDIWDKSSALNDVCAYLCKS